MVEEELNHGIGKVVARTEVPHDIGDLLVHERDVAPRKERLVQVCLRALASEVFRPDIFRRALADADVPIPGASMKVEGALGLPLAVGSRKGELTLGPDRFFDGRVFDPERMNDYLANFVSPR